MSQFISRYVAFEAGSILCVLKTQLKTNAGFEDDWC